MTQRKVLVYYVINKPEAMTGIGPYAYQYEDGPFPTHMQASDQIDYLVNVLGRKNKELHNYFVGEVELDVEMYDFN